MLFYSRAVARLEQGEFEGALKDVACIAKWLLPGKADELRSEILRRQKAKPSEANEVEAQRGPDGAPPPKHTEAAKPQLPDRGLHMVTPHFLSVNTTHESRQAPAPSNKANGAADGVASGALSSSAKPQPAAAEPVPVSVAAIDYGKNDADTFNRSMEECLQSHADAVP